MKCLALPVLVMAAGAVTASAQGAPDGTWKGKTSQAKEIAVTVKGAAIVSIKLGFGLKMDAPCAERGSPVAVDYRGGETEKTYFKPLAILNSGFAAPIGLVDAKISGKFAGDEVKGNLELQANAASGCSGKAKLTWSATRAAAPAGLVVGGAASPAPGRPLAKAESVAKAEKIIGDETLFPTDFAQKARTLMRDVVAGKFESFLLTLGLRQQ